MIKYVIGAGRKLPHLGPENSKIGGIKICGDIYGKTANSFAQNW